MVSRINNRAMLEIANIIGVRKKWSLKRLKKLTPKEIMVTYEYEMFRRKHPALCEFAEGIRK